jgi:hypothetical protein
MSEKKILSGQVVKLAVVITLDVLDGAPELCGRIGEFFDKVVNVSDFNRRGKVHK